MLLPQHTVFTRCLAEGMKQVDAYAEAYPDVESRSSMTAAASRLAKQPQTQAEVKRILDEIEAATVEKVSEQRAYREAIFAEFIEVLSDIVMTDPMAEIHGQECATGRSFETVDIKPGTPLARALKGVE